MAFVPPRLRAHAHCGRASRTHERERGEWRAVTSRPMTFGVAGRSMKQPVVVIARANANDGDDEAFENKISALRGKRSKRAAKSEENDRKDGERRTTTTPTTGGGARAKGVREFTRTDTIEEPEVNWGNEVVIYEGPPARGEVVANVLMSWTVVWVPLTIQAIGRALWLKYKITDKRVSVISESPLRKERTDVPMDQIKDVISVGRGIGQWGDMVITLRNGEKVELRSLPNFKECEKAIAERMYKEKVIDF